MRLAQLIQELPQIHTDDAPEIEIQALTQDSRQVAAGALFVAVRGTFADGHEFMGQAVERGAVAVVGEAPAPDLGVPYFQVDDSRQALALMSSAWYGHPSRKLVMIGVTGTDGKTTTAYLIHKILLAAGLPAGMITTVVAVIGDRTLDTGFHITTPDPLAVQALLAEMTTAGITHCVVEATSHGLAQHRVTGCDFDLGVVTNITHEHLDYHGTYEAYRQAKGKLFAGLAGGIRKPGGPGKVAVLNYDDSSFGFLSELAKVRQVTYGLNVGAAVRAEGIRSGPDGLQFLIRWGGIQQAVSSPLLGEYNVSNCLAAFAATVYGLGLAPEEGAEGIQEMSGVPGRMERIDLGQPFTAIVDFAHTPNALRRALETLRTLTEGRLIAVFGSAGLRDWSKRRMMAEVSAELADLTVLTAEDPRTESLDSILEQMAEGARSKGGVEGDTYWKVADRGEAIRFATRIAQPGDIVVSCGKGHEQSMCFDEVEHSWDDRVAMRAALAELMGVGGPAMPRLPTSP